MVRPKKHLGQHFLTDPTIAQRIVDLMFSQPEDVVIEVGPGTGVLTEWLLKKKFSFIPVEIDTESVAHLKAKWPQLDGVLVEGDFLKLDLDQFPGDRIHIVGNFPYNISSQIFFKVLENRHRVDSVVCMLQKEVAQRISSPHGSKTYGILSVLLQAYYNIEYLFSVKPGSFHPPPKVTSGVIRMTRNERKALPCDEDLFRRVVKTTFNQRRKMIRNSIQSILLNLDSDYELLSKRPEQLDVQQFIELTLWVAEQPLNTSDPLKSKKVMSQKLTREFLDEMLAAIKIRDDAASALLLGLLHPADIADIYDELSIEEATYLYMLLDPEIASDVLVELEENDREKFLSSLPSEVIASQFIDHMDSDDAADVIGDLTEEKKQEVLLHIDDVEQAGDIVDLLGYDEDTAGGLMAKELIRVNENWGVATCIREMRKQAEDLDEIYYIYVVNNENVLLGILSLKALLLASASTKVRDIYNADIRSVQTDASSEEVAQIMEKYDLIVLPVTDSIGRLMGRITIDDVVDVIREEAERDYQLASGITADVETTDSPARLSRARLPWLIIGLVGGIIVAAVIGRFEEDIKINPEMAFFIPLIAAMAGNVGIQSSAIIVQGIASNSLGLETTSKKLLKELWVALLNGLILSGLLFLYNFFVSDNLALTFTVSTSLFVVIIFAALFGTLIPLLLNRAKIDPALATGPFITTMNDIMGLMIYFLMGRVLYGIFI